MSKWTERRWNLGKRPSRFAGAGESAVINILHAPTLASNCTRTHINVNVSGVGEVIAIIDSGAAKSAVRHDIIAGYGHKINPPRRRWVCADGFADGVMGETEVTVEHEGRAVHLPEVVVFKNLVEPFLLGMEWIDAARVAVMANDHAGVVVYRETTTGALEGPGVKCVISGPGGSSLAAEKSLVEVGKTQESPNSTEGFTRKEGRE